MVAVDHNHQHKAEQCGEEDFSTAKVWAIAARLGAKVSSARMLIMPPTKLALYASESARLGCPCLVML